MYLGTFLMAGIVWLLVRIAPLIRPSAATA